MGAEILITLSVYKGMTGQIKQELLMFYVDCGVDHVTLNLIYNY